MYVCSSYEMWEACNQLINEVVVMNERMMLTLVGAELVSYIKMYKYARTNIPHFV